MKFPKRTNCTIGFIAAILSFGNGPISSHDDKFANLSVQKRLPVIVLVGESTRWASADDSMYWGDDLVGDAIDSIGNATSSRRSRKAYDLVRVSSTLNIEEEVRAAFSCSTDPTVRTFCSAIDIPPRAAKKTEISEIVSRNQWKEALVVKVWFAAENDGLQIKAYFSPYPRVKIPMNTYDYGYTRDAIVSFLVPSPMTPPKAVPKGSSESTLLESIWLNGKPSIFDQSLKAALAEIRDMAIVPIESGVLNAPRDYYLGMFKYPPLSKLKAQGISCKGWLYCNSRFLLRRNGDRTWLFQPEGGSPDIVGIISRPKDLLQ